MGRKLPEDPEKGEEITRKENLRNGERLVTYKATGKKGFGKWKFVANNPVETEHKRRRG